MNDLFDEKCLKCEHCNEQETWCDKFKMNPCLSLEECFEKDFIDFKKKE